MSKGPPIIIIGIDPGTVESAYVQLRNGKIHDHAKVENRHLLDVISSLDLPYHWGDGGRMIAIEFLQSFGMPVGKEVFETAYLIGRIQQCAIDRKVEVLPVYRKQVVLHHCGSPRAKDANIRQAMLDRWGPQGTKKTPGPTYGIKADVWSALAIASYALDQQVVEAGDE